MAVRILFAVAAAFPIVFMLVSSLKPDQQIFGDMSSVAAFLPIGNISFDNKGDVKNGALTLYAYKGDKREQMAVVR